MDTNITRDYAPIARHIRAFHRERTVRIAERIAELLVAAWNEIKAPPRPAWIIVEGRENTRTADRFMRFVPR